jgi:hypothetical protein
MISNMVSDQILLKRSSTFLNFLPLPSFNSSIAATVSALGVLFPLFTLTVLRPTLLKAL